MQNACDCSNAAPNYMGAIVLGLNDAIVELSGALAGFTMVLPDCRLIFLAGLTTGIAATLSMAAAEFLSQEAETNCIVSWKAALYTGIAYLITVFLLLLPYAFCEGPIYALLICLAIGASIIIIFTFFEAKVRRRSFKRLCTQMLIVSFGVALISFFISWLADKWWGVGL